MNTFERILKTHPRAENVRVAETHAASEALFACIEACTVCADACLAEPHVDKLRRCLRGTLDCADICSATLRLVARQTDTIGEMVRQQVHACLVACQLCAEECETHEHAHCRMCAQACRRCQEACNRLMGEISSSGTIPADPLESAE
jgi:hypothetical protein